MNQALIAMLVPQYKKRKMVKKEPATRVVQISLIHPPFTYRKLKAKKVIKYFM